MKKFVLLLAIVFFNAAVFAQQSFFDNYVYQNWDTFGTLNGTSVTDLIQTTDGYINIGTYEGLARFDGEQFSTHKKSKNNDLSFISVRTILEDTSGNLWIGSNDEGLQLITPTYTKVFTTENGLPNNSIRCLAEDRKGNIWVGTAAGVVYLTKSNHMITPQFEAGTVSKGVICTSLYCDTSGRIWLITANERGLFVYQRGLFYTVPQLDKFGIYFATAIGQEKGGAFWVALGSDGIIRVENGNIQKIKTHSKLDSVVTNCIFRTESGDLWFGTEKGITVLHEGKFHDYSGSVLAESKINRIMCDRENNMWFATDRNGIGKLRKGCFRMMKLGVTTNSITEDRYGNIWIGTDNGVRCYKDDLPVSNTLTEYTKGLRIRDVNATKSGSILVSCYTEPGQLLYDGKTIRNWSMKDGLAGNKVRVAIETKNGDIYAGTTTGLSIIHKDGSIRNYKLITGLDNEYIMALYEDTNGIIWIGTDGGGVYTMKDEVILSHLTTEDGLAGNVIFKINQNLDGAYWICTGSGITRCLPFASKPGYPDSYVVLNSDSGLETDSMFQVLIDGTNHMWMISNHGISTAPFSDVLDYVAGKIEKIDVKFFNKNDGLDSSGPTSTAKSLVDRYGRLWITMVDGFAVYDPQKISENPIMPLVQIEKVTVDNQVIVDNTLYPTAQKEIILKAGTKRVDIAYSGISFEAPERIKFTHRLTNFEQEFCFPTSDRSMTYTNLSPGNHKFIVNSISGDGFYSEQAQVLLFVQKPYIYQLPAFWIILVIAVIGSLSFFFYRRQIKIVKENIRLEAMVQERTSELKVEKEKSDHLLRAILPDQIANELKDNVHSIGQNFDDATILFSDIVNFTKTSSGCTAEQIVDALNNLFTLFDIRAQKYGVEKIKTIGDAYMAACGLPSPNENHALVMANFAKGMLEDVETYNKTALIKFKIRIGLNSGPVTAGVIGRTKFIYDVWGDTVNVASRMETAAPEDGIKVSDALHTKLIDSTFEFSEPEQCNIKGKGLMTTWNIL